MNTKTIKTPNFMGSIAKLVKEIQTRICIDDADVEILEGLLKDELNKYCNLIGEYYEEKYYNAISEARNRAYDAGHSDGYGDGYENGYDDGHSESHSAV
jgi:hypothetical protein